jgi:hypothetical protein
MGPFEMVVLIVFIGTVGKVAQTFMARPSRLGAPGADDRIRVLETELRANEARLAQAEEKVAELGEKLVFVEQLLARPESHAQLASSPQQPGLTPLAEDAGLA